MADEVYSSDGLCLLHTDHAAIRHDISTSAGEILRTTESVGSDVRMEIAENGCETVKTVMGAECNIRRDIADGSYRAAVAADAVGDRMTTQIDKQFNRVEARDFDTMKELAEFKGTSFANQNLILAEIRLAAERAAKDSEIYALRNQIALGDKIAFEGAETRKLMNQMKYDDLNRALIERNADLVEERHEHRHYRHGWEQSQYQALQSQFQAFNSQLAETRQGMVNFGVMAGVGQSSTSNQVR